VRYEFDGPVERHGTCSLKWDFAERFTGRAGLLPLWVADMDFPAPPEIREALERRVAHGIYGYTIHPDSLFQAAQAWWERRHGWSLERGWMASSPGVVTSIAVAIQAFSRPGDRIVIQTPVYHPFGISIRDAGRQVLENPLRLEGGRWRMDLASLEKEADSRTRMIVLSSPHNPVGRVWEREELEALVDLCIRRDMLIVSDEIHCDLLMPGHRHLPTASLSAAASAVTVTCVAATKTFNLAGLGGSFTIIPNERLRVRYRTAQAVQHSDLVNPLSVAALEAAWRECGDWLDQLLAHIKGNYDFLVSFLRDRLPAVAAAPLEGTYLAWLDMGGLGLSDDEVTSRLLDGAGVWLDDGKKFGIQGTGYRRLNLACPRSILEDALARMEKALKG
jgi:cysteine-S-conjugate beta-lyase